MKWLIDTSSPKESLKGPTEEQMQDTEIRWEFKLVNIREHTDGTVRLCIAEIRHMPNIIPMVNYRFDQGAMERMSSLLAMSYFAGRPATTESRCFDQILANASVTIIYKLERVLDSDEPYVTWSCNSR
jgi:hypothetical protein